jgi:hypothetical protein
MPVESLCARRLTRGTKVDLTDADNDSIVDDALNMPFQKTPANQFLNAAETQLHSEMALTRPISGGVLSSRFFLHIISSPGTSADDSNHLRINVEKAQMLPSFSGCPSWSKPLLLQEYQVLKTQHTLSLCQF